MICTYMYIAYVCLQCFDAVGWAAGRHPACKNRVVEYWRGYLVLPFWYRLTWVVPEKRPLNVCVCLRTYIAYVSVSCQT